MTDRQDTQELATGYTSSNTTQFNAALFLLDRLKINAGSHILDVGCGPGNLTLHLKDLAGPSGSVVGIDPSAQRIDIAKSNAKQGVTYHVGIAEDLSLFPSGTFDVVFVNSTLHWVQDQPLAIREFGRVLKVGGKIGISGGSGDFVAIHEKIKADVLSREPYRQYPELNGPNFLKKAELEGLLADAGFTDVNIETNTIVKAAATSDEMINWLDTSSSGQTYGGIPLDLRSKAREEMKIEWEKFVTKDGIRMDMELLVTVATRR